MLGANTRNSIFRSFAGIPGMIRGIPGVITGLPGMIKEILPTQIGVSINAEAIAYNLVITTFDFTSEAIKSFKIVRNLAVIADMLWPGSPKPRSEHDPDYEIELAKFDYSYFKANFIRGLDVSETGIKMLLTSTLIRADKPQALIQQFLFKEMIKFTYVASINGFAYYYENYKFNPLKATIETSYNQWLKDGSLPNKEEIEEIQFFLANKDYIQLYLIAPENLIKPALDLAYNGREIYSETITKCWKDVNGFIRESAIGWAKNVVTYKIKAPTVFGSLSYKAKALEKAFMQNQLESSNQISIEEGFPYFNNISCIVPLNCDYPGIVYNTVTAPDSFVNEQAFEENKTIIFSENLLKDAPEENLLDLEAPVMGDNMNNVNDEL